MCGHCLRGMDLFVATSCARRLAKSYHHRFGRHLCRRWFHQTLGTHSVVLEFVGLQNATESATWRILCFDKNAHGNGLSQRDGAYFAILDAQWPHADWRNCGLARRDARVAKHSTRHTVGQLVSLCLQQVISEGWSRSHPSGLQPMSITRRKIPRNILHGRAFGEDAVSQVV